MNPSSASKALLFVVCSLLAGCLTNPNQPPTLLRGDVLSYPEAARREGLQGAVEVRYDVAADGRVMNARILSATPEGIFEEAALEAVRGWRFRPGRRKGVESPYTGLVSTIEFRFGETDDYPAR